MGNRIPAPDGKTGSDGRPLLVLPKNTILKGSYIASYFTTGGMSIGYLARKGGKVFFIKEVEGSQSDRVVALSQEKATLERLNHWGIVKCVDFFEQEGFYYLVVDYIDGVSLDKLISPTSTEFISEKDAIDWAFQLCDIFEYLHSQTPPIIYRDLKPHNVMKDSMGQLHLVDFGIARVFKTGKESDTSVVGSYLTASPEHYGAKQTDERSDIFTLGATLHCILTNGHGRSDDFFGFVPISKINPGVSELLEEALARTIEFNPDDRYQSVAEMREAFVNVSQGKRIPLPSTSRGTLKVAAQRARNEWGGMSSTRKLAPEEEAEWEAVLHPEMPDSSSGSLSGSLPARSYVPLIVVLLAIIIGGIALFRVAFHPSSSNSKPPSSGVPAFLSPGPPETPLPSQDTQNSLRQMENIFWSAWFPKSYRQTKNPWIWIATEPVQRKIEIMKLTPKEEDQQYTDERYCELYEKMLKDQSIQNVDKQGPFYVNGARHYVYSYSEGSSLQRDRLMTREDCKYAFLLSMRAPKDVFDYYYSSEFQPFIDSFTLK
ncbi:MAG: serine/threonine-protein kinase [Candidatus Eremiobacteraeota bacterium]|nr:serine/threonine-protein kinase [Candidatus Eremiobacteraeota bacterium]